MLDNIKEEEKENHSYGESQQSSPIGTSTSSIEHIKDTPIEHAKDTQADHEEKKERL